MKTASIILLLIISVQLNGQEQPTVTLNSLLNEMVDISSVARWPVPEYTMSQASSYDRRSVSPNQPGWFANDDNNQFIREENKAGHTEYVMMDADGPGAVVRFWLTMQSSLGRLRIYFDNEEKPSVQIEAYDLMKSGFDVGKALLNYHRPAQERGNTMYLPLPYQKHCKITFERMDNLPQNTPHYYQVNYRTYPKGTRVRTFTMNDLHTEKATLERINNELLNPTLNCKGDELKWKKIVAAGKEKHVVMPNGPAAIKMLTLKLSAKDKQELQKAWSLVVLKMEFDGQQTVWCPIGDFAGSGFGGQQIKSWYRDVDSDGKVTTRWVMPYRKNVRISIVNMAPFDIDVNISVITGDWKWDNRSMYFHVNYRYEPELEDVAASNVPGVAPADTLNPKDWSFVSIRGKGIYLGNTLSLYNNMNLWYGEGDAKAWVDDEKFPSEFGTGLEDYYNLSWAPVFIYQTPFANAPRADKENSHGYNTFTRTRNLDGIPFKNSFRYDLEMLCWKKGTIDCCATTYWYGFPRAVSDIETGKNQPELPFLTLNKN